jgi:transglutaminase-like putative cysteine protease
MSTRWSWCLRLVPTAADGRDAVFAAVLAGIGVYGFHSSFGGGEELSVGLPAVVIGLVVGYVLGKVRAQLLVGTLVGVVCFFLLGGLVALRGEALVGVLPGPDVIEGLVDGAVNGWVRLLTTVPPAGQAGHLLAIPYLVGYSAAALGVVLAIRFRGLPVCVLPASIALALGILFGVEDPVSLLLQGGAFAAITVTWLALRAPSTSLGSLAQPRRLASALLMLAVVVAGAFVVGPALPGADDNERYLLREQITPPFDPSQYPSPLTRFRRFDGPEPIEDVLFTVEGLPPGEKVRFAVMDDYDGYVWRASPPASGDGGTYQRVGDTISGAADGEHATVTFEMGALASADSVWVPTAGSPVAISFEGPRADELTEAYRFNRATETAASPVALQAGDRWTVTAAFPISPPPEELDQLAAAPSSAMSALPGLTDEVKGELAEWVAGADSPRAQAAAVTEVLKTTGARNNGSDPALPVPAGHSLARLIPFLSARQPQGNDEQYAAAVAYAAEALGIPARVVMEMDPPDGGGPVEVRAADVNATVEIGLAGAGWVPLGEVTSENTPQPDIPAEKPRQRSEVQPPPPTTQPPNEALPDEHDREQESSDESTADSSGWGWIGTALRAVAYVTVPLLILLLPVLAIVVFKSRRRRRRRTRGSASQRLSAGWDEVVDVARDIGAPVPAKATRLEVARLVPSPDAERIAQDADAGTFGAEDPSEAQIDDLWGRVATTRDSLLESLGTWKRFRAMVSVSSLRASR